MPGTACAVGLASRKPRAFMIRNTYLSLALPAALAACAATPRAVPIVGATSDVAALAGEWSGDYSGPGEWRAPGDDRASRGLAE